MNINVDEVLKSVEAKRKKPASQKIDVENIQFLTIRRNEKVHEHFAQLEREKCYVFTTAGRWSQYELLNYILTQTGPADIYISTWKINMDAATNLFGLCKNGLVTKLWLILEKRIPVTSPDALELIKMHADRIRITDNHSKVMCIINDNWAVTVYGSANMTTNPRIECGVLFTMREVANFTREWMEDVINEQLF